MRRTWVWALATIGAASVAALVASLLLPGLEELSWAAGTGSFVLAAAAVALAWPQRAPSSLGPAPSSAPAGARVDNHVGDVHGTAAQFGPVHGSVTVHSPPALATPPVPGWVQVALPAGQADAHELGAHHALPGPDGEGLPPYVARDVDDELDHHLAAAAVAPRGGLVLVAGASTAGKTRALAAGLARTLPGRMLISPPEDVDLRPLPVWLKESSARAPQGWVVWLDDLDRHLSASGLTPALVAELGVAGAVVAATIRQERLEALRPSATDPAPGTEGVGYAVLKTPPITVRREWSGPERERTRSSDDPRLVRAADDERFGVAEQLAAGPHLQGVWENGLDSGHPRGYALVATAVGLAQAGVSSPLTREQLHTAHNIYLPAPPPLPEEADRAWEWATRPRSGLAGLLVPADHEGHRWRAFDYLTTQASLPDAVWHAALNAATDQDRFTIGITASNADRADITETAWRSLAEQGNTRVMSNLGALLAEAGRAGEAENWFRKAAQQGHTLAMVNLRTLLEEAGLTEEAEIWRQRARLPESGAVTEPLTDDGPAWIGPYQLHSRLGAGGMGQMFLGRSPEGRTVAVKVLRPELADDADFRRRFANEMAVAFKVRGFYTAQFVDADLNANPPWLATDYIPGPTLHRAVTDHGPLPAALVSVLGAGLAEGLTDVHAQNLLHRALNPTNVILAADGPRLIDFGIPWGTESPTYIAAQPVIGTIGSMSPEQARGSEASTASDVFALGCVLAFAATGRSPFGKGPVHAVILRIAHEEPDLTGVPASLVELVKACLAKEPSYRPSLDRILARLGPAVDVSASARPAQQWLWG